MTILPPLGPGIGLAAKAVAVATAALSLAAELGAPFVALRLGAVAALTLLVSFLLSRAGPEADLAPFGAPPRASVSSLAPPPDGRPPLPLSREDRPPPDLGAPTAVAADPSAGQDPGPSPRDEHSRRRRGSRRVRSTHGAKRPAAPE